jgi:DHA2 family multidrug resistance protein
VPLTGFLAQRFGAVRLFVGSVLMFVLSSWLCGLAPSFGWLVALRVLQGASAGPMVPLSQTLLMSSFPPARVGTAFALWSMTTLIAPVVGPLLGGWITDNIAWPWIFYINVPVGLAAAAATWAIYRRRETPTRKLPIDGVGLSLIVLWVGSLQLMLDKGKELDWFASPEIVVLAVVAAVGAAVFIAWELTDAHPVVDLRLFKGRNFLFGALTLSIAYGLFFGNLVILPLWLQQWNGYTATWAAMALAPVGVLAILLTPLIGRKVGIWDPRRIATFSFVVFAVAMWMRSDFSTDANFGHILVPTLIQGAAVATFFIPLTGLTLAGISPERIASAAGLSNFCRITAGAMGTSIATTLWESRATLHHAHLAEQLAPGKPGTDAALAALSRAGLPGDAGLGLITRWIDQQAYTRAADDLFLVSSLLFLLLIPLVWLTRRPPPPAARGAAPAGAGGAH